MANQKNSSATKHSINCKNSRIKNKNKTDIIFRSILSIAQTAVNENNEKILKIFKDTQRCLSEDFNLRKRKDNIGNRWPDVAALHRTEAPRTFINAETQTDGDHNKIFSDDDSDWLNTYMRLDNSSSLGIPDSPTGFVGYDEYIKMCREPERYYGSIQRF